MIIEMSVNKWAYILYILYFAVLGETIKYAH